MPPLISQFVSCKTCPCHADSETEVNANRTVYDDDDDDDDDDDGDDDDYFARLVLAMLPYRQKLMLVYQYLMMMMMIIHKGSTVQMELFWRPN